MTLAQKKARENFKKAIAYRKKTGCSLKQAFAYVKGGKVTGVKKAVVKKKAVKKAAKKKPVSSHKDTKSHNVNIRVVSGVSDTAINEIKHINDMLKKWKIVLLTLQQEKKLQKNNLDKKLISMDIQRVKNVISDFKMNLNRLKKHIK